MRLNSDELGEKGEARFKELCADAQLTCNKSDRDRTGWDFLVEFPFPPNSKETLDKRKTPASAYFQLKTVRENTPTIKLRLSAVERLAKELRPSFICILKVNSRLDVVGMHVIHLLNKPLEKILERLRREQARGNFAINKQSLTFNIRKYALRADVSGDSLRDTISKACLSDMNDYSVLKQRQLKELGFEGAPYKATVTLRLGPGERISDVFLGLRKGIDVVDFRASETRFGISLPLEIFQDGKITFTPTAGDTCEILVRETLLGRPVKFFGEAFFTPSIIPLEDRKTLLKTEFFALHISSDFLNLDVPEEVYKHHTTRPKRWAEFLKFLQLMRSGGAIIEIAPNKSRRFTLPPLKKPSSATISGDFRELIQLCNQAEEIFLIAGVSEKVAVKLSDIEVASGFIAPTHSILKGSGNVTMSGVIAKPTADVPSKNACSFACFTTIGAITIAYVARADLEIKINGEDAEIELKNFSGLAAKNLEQFPLGYDEFVNEITQSNRLTMLVKMQASNENFDINLLGMGAEWPKSRKPR